MKKGVVMLQHYVKCTYFAVLILSFPFDDVCKYKLASSVC